MNNSIIGELEFKTGWKRKEEFVFLGTLSTITLNVRAFYEKDGITPEQEKAYSLFDSSRDKIYNAVDSALLAFDENAKDRFSPRTLLINRDGSCALTCDDEEDPDDGIAVTIYPDIEILSQDEYL